MRRGDRGRIPGGAVRARPKTKVPVEIMSRPETKALVETRVMELPRAPETRMRSRPTRDEEEGEAACARAKDDGNAGRQRRERG
jgi:hypothetical protein